jgi:hypothetical protein
VFRNNLEVVDFLEKTVNFSSPAFSLKGWPVQEVSELWSFYLTLEAGGLKTGKLTAVPSFTSGEEGIRKFLEEEVFGWAEDFLSKAAAVAKDPKPFEEALEHLKKEREELYRKLGWEEEQELDFSP